MDSALTNDFAMAFQMVSDNEKKKNKKIVEITKEIISTIIEIKESAVFFKRKENAKK